LSPFGEYTFHLLGKETPEGIIWRYGWGITRWLTRSLRPMAVLERMLLIPQTGPHASCALNPGVFGWNRL
jgi:hypothetical protein